MYYNEAYDDINVEFISMTDFIEQDLQNEVSNQYTIVQPKINQCGRIRVAAEIFGSVLAPRYKKNSHILAKFIQKNNRNLNQNYIIINKSEKSVIFDILQSKLKSSRIMY